MFDLYHNVLEVMDIEQDNGNNESSLPSYSEYCICRAVRNGSGQHIVLSSGEDYRYSYVVYMPAGTPAIKDGTPIKILDGADGFLLATGRARCFISSPIGCKMWI